MSSTALYSSVGFQEARMEAQRQVLTNGGGPTGIESKSRGSLEGDKANKG